MKALAVESAVVGGVSLCNVWLGFPIASSTILVVPGLSYTNTSSSSKSSGVGDDGLVKDSSVRIGVSSSNKTGSGLPMMGYIYIYKP